MTTDADRADRDADIVRLLASGRTYAEAGAVLGLSEATIYRRVRSERLTPAVAIERRAMVERLVGEMLDLGPLAVSTLRGIMLDPSAPTRERTVAARSALTWLKTLLPRRTETVTAEAGTIIAEMTAEETLGKLAEIHAQIAATLAEHGDTTVTWPDRPTNSAVPQSDSVIHLARPDRSSERD